MAAVTCADHRPMQHMDGQPPWCRACVGERAGTAMFIQPTPQEARKGGAPTIRVTTETLGRVLNPEQNGNLFTDAARTAHTEALDNGYQAVSYESVAEFIAGINDDGELSYQYVWMFSAWDGPDSRQ